MTFRALAALLPLAAFALPALPLAAQVSPAPPPALPGELVLPAAEPFVTLRINGVPMRLEVSGEAFGPPVLNPEAALKLGLTPTEERGWRFGPVVVTGLASQALADFGAGAVPMMVSWTDRTASTRADGVIGVHALPYPVVTLAFHAPAPGEVAERFAMKRAGGTRSTRLGTEIKVGKRKLLMIFVSERPENLVTAPTANFLATHREGGFEPGSEGLAVLDFAVERPVRMMRLADPIALGSLSLERFAVRVEDYGEPSRVGEIAQGDPRFDKDNIYVTRRKGLGRPDLLTRIGSDQIARCSALTYDLGRSEIRLACLPPPPDAGHHP